MSKRNQKRQRSRTVKLKRQAEQERIYQLKREKRKQKHRGR